MEEQGGPGLKLRLGLVEARVGAGWGPTSTLRQPYVNPTSSLPLPYLNPTSTPRQPYVNPTSTLRQPYLNPTSTLRQTLLHINIHPSPPDHTPKATAPLFW